MKRDRKNEGFTLVELMVTVAISAIVILMVSLILFMTYHEWRADNVYTQLRRDAALAVQYMAQDVRESTTNANSITVVPFTSITFAANLVRPDVHAFIKSGETLRRDINGALFGVIITKGLRQFNPVETPNGVLLHLVLTDDDYNIAITNETFITVRN